jgi:hypothetical protein
VSLGGKLLKMVSEPLPNLDGRSVHKPMKDANGHSLGRKEWGDPHDDHKWGHWVSRGDDCDVPIAWV